MRPRLSLEATKDTKNTDTNVSPQIEPEIAYLVRSKMGRLYRLEVKGYILSLVWFHSTVSLTSLMELHVEI